MRKLLILPRTGLGGREECPRQKVASDGLLKYIWLPGKVYSSDMMIGPWERRFLWTWVAGVGRKKKEIKTQIIIFSLKYTFSLISKRLMPIWKSPPSSYKNSNSYIMLSFSVNGLHLKYLGCQLVSLYKPVNAPEKGSARDCWKTEGLPWCQLRSAHSIIRGPGRLVGSLDVSGGNDDANDNSYHLFSAGRVLGTRWAWLRAYHLNHHEVPLPAWSLDRPVWMDLRGNRL